LSVTLSTAALSANFIDREIDADIRVVLFTGAGVERAVAEPAESLPE
jgi:hypothetical protein